MGMKFDKKDGSAISQMALAVNQFLVEAALLTRKLFQQQISVKNGHDGKTIQARA